MKEDSEECESETICLKSEMNVLCLNVVIISIIPKRKKEEGQFLMKKKFKFAAHKNPSFAHILST